jgi:hypothetical protein
LCCRLAEMNEVLHNISHSASSFSSSNSLST